MKIIKNKNFLSRGAGIRHAPSRSIAGLAGGEPGIFWSPAELKPVGDARFELATSCSQSMRDNQLR